MYIFQIDELKEARKKNEERVHFYLHDDVDLFGLVDAVKSLYHNQTSPTGLCFVALSGTRDPNESFRAWDIPALKALMDTISKIPTVKCLGFQWIHRQNKVPLELLSSAFQKMKQLDTLEFKNISLVGEQEQVQEFAKGLQSMPGLRTYLSLDMSIFGSNDILQSTAVPLNLDTIFTTISGLPMICEVDLECSDDAVPGSEDIWRQGITSIKTLQSLLSSTQISSLRLSIGELELDQEGLQSLVLAIGNNSNMVELGLFFLSPDYDDNNDAAPGTQRDKAHAPPLFLAQALQINTTLKVLSVKFHDVDTPFPEYEGFLAGMANAIGKNPKSCIRKLAIDGPDIFPPGAKDAFINLLKTSYRLETLAYDVEGSRPEDGCTWVTGEKQASIDFYLRMNVKGREGIMGKAIEKVPRARLVSMLASVSNDLDALYYYLHSNPCVCREEVNNASQPRAKKRRRPSYTPQDDEVHKLKKVLGDAQEQLGTTKKELGEALEEIKRLKRLIGGKNVTSYSIATL